MRVPLSWMREFTDCELPAEEIAARLTMSGVEVEAIDRIGAFSDGVVAGRLTSAQPLERSRDLKLAEVDVGGRTVRAITGAPNIPVGGGGLTVAVALPGARLIAPDADAFTLVEVEAKEMLGARSEAVLCSAMELGIALDHSGVLVLPADFKPGTRLQELPALPSGAEADEVLEISVLPNYGRCLSVIGVAREVAALTRSSFRLRLDAEYLPVNVKAFPVEIEAPELCRRYSALVLDGLRVGASPRWLQRRLVLGGLAPINNVVDVTNYVMLEVGQPMHAFDLKRLPSRRIEVRRARPGEPIWTLDQKSGAGDAAGDALPRQLHEDMVVIASAGKPVAVGGIIGGRGSEIHDDTTDVLLESANFDAVAIRKGMSKLGITTESAARFSREVDPALTVTAIYRAARLLKDVAGAQPGRGIADVYPSPFAARVITVRCGRICRILGAEVTAGEIQTALERLGFSVEPLDPETLSVSVPGFRPDVSLEADVAEEVIRAVGFGRLSPRFLCEPLPVQERNTALELREAVRDALAGWGLQDVINYSLTTPAAESRLEAAAEHRSPTARAPEYVRIQNPVSQDRSVLRRTLLAGLLENVARNHRQRQRIVLFEIGPVFLPEEGDGTLPRESLRLGVVLSGTLREPTWADPSPPSADVFALKGMVSALLRKLRIDGTSFETCAAPPYHPGMAASLRIGTSLAGSLGQVHPAVTEAYDLGERVVIAAELDLGAILDAARRYAPYRPFSRFPSVRQDIALVVAEAVPAERIEAAIRRAAGPLLESVRLFDLYRGQQLEPGTKSLAFELNFASDERSLTEEEVNALREAMLEPLAQELGARIR